ncbi:hypothetical protein CKM354_001013600 [Cercospora kikuchii]|uniref:LysM domain-containing protein n=1 Tax=Cercospora kikuchii TaxID=84275 RepID=A0A9P3CWF3_9PEZI|nr:uncharacterized protein CKM354_001013600 [Cercospora kikuchii]GIZ47035.1 hypothetical protein CKM354_001013600 [Cercospora kikuchii]
MASWRYDRDDDQHHEMNPVGYDADTQVYTYRDDQGNYYQTEEGTGRHGNLNYTHTSANVAPQSGFNGENIPAEAIENDWKMMKPFFLLVTVVLMTILWYINSGGSGKVPAITCGPGFEKYRIAQGDTCWGIAEKRKTSVEKLVEANSGIVCANLKVGKAICVPEVQ